MIRKTPLLLIGAATGAVLTVMATQPRTVFDLSSARAATVDAYRQLTLFGDVFEQVRSDYVERPDDSKLIESAIKAMEAGLIKVVSPIDETPAAKAGIMANDIISHIDDEPVQGLALNQAVDKMRGPVNSKISLKIIRDRK